MSVSSESHPENVKKPSTDQDSERDQHKVRVPSERGVKLIHNPVFNKGTAFTKRERLLFGLRGLLPPVATTQELQAERIMMSIRGKTNDLEKYIYLVSLQDRNENLFYYVIRRHLEELMPIIYTPTVGQACQSFGHIYRRSRGLYISLEDRGHVREILLNWPHNEVKVIVVTDGGRILGLGDLGINGMGIPIGKLALYTACAGIDPTFCLPITVDVGTSNESLLKDPLYLGNKQPRITGTAYQELFDEFICAVQEIFPDAVVQFEDFSTANAFMLLDRYRRKARVFNDDIQGTASVALAGLLSALRITNQKIQDQKTLFLGAGEAGIGIADMISLAMRQSGLSEEQSRQQNWFMDSSSLVCGARTNLAGHKLRYAHDHPPINDFIEAIETLKPTAIIGVCGQQGKFTEEVVRTMSRINDKPIIFALSNPTSKAECTAEEAYTWSEGRAIFASGSPFKPVELMGRKFVPGQGNNVYIFPGVGLGLALSNPKMITERMFYEAAKALSLSVTEDELAKGTIYPSFLRIKEVSVRIALSTIQVGLDDDLVARHFESDLEETIKSFMYTPDYAAYV